MFDSLRFFMFSQLNLLGVLFSVFLPALLPFLSVTVSLPSTRMMDGVG